MVLDTFKRCCRNRFGISAVLAGLLLAFGFPANANHTKFRVYDTDSGLLSLDGSCMAQDPAGYLLVCTQHGLFAYDGRVFTNLGSSSGLPSGGEVFSLALSTNGRLAVAYADDVFISERPVGPSPSPDLRVFKRVSHPGMNSYSEHIRRLVAWHDSFVFVAGDEIEHITGGGEAPPHFVAMAYSRENQLLLRGPTALFSSAGHLWTTFEDGRICLSDPGSVKCYGGPELLLNGPWRDVVESPDHHVMARSRSSVASFDADLNRWFVVSLPDQGGRYDNYEHNLSLFAAPDGGMTTPTAHGVAVLSAGAWHPLTVSDGAPAGTIMDAMTDSTGQMWFQVLGVGLVRWLGYGRWESIQKQDGLTEGLPWMTARAPGGPLWVSTDTGVDEIIERGTSLGVARVLPGASFAVAIGPHGDLWRSAPNGVRVTDQEGEHETKIALPLVNTIVRGADETMWVGTEGGLFCIRRSGKDAFTPVLVGNVKAPVVDVALDRAGDPFYLTSGRLHHLHKGTTDVAVGGVWPEANFQPEAIVIDHSGVLWIGGLGGLFRLDVINDRAIAYEEISTQNIRTNSVEALLIDHREWLWVGTATGLSVFDGNRWRSIDTDSGLISDDVDQHGIREDPDGSIWVATTMGVSHLLDPTWVFSESPINVVISSARLGGQPVTGQSFPFSEQPLALQFGTSDYGIEKSIRFKYRLSEVDSDWAESFSGAVRYPFIPPGHHLLSVVAYDTLSHRSSTPVTLVVDVGYPWWRQWWSEVIGSLIFLAVVVVASHFRTKGLRERQIELQKHVDEATEKLRLQADELQYQAAHDRLTGLLTRCEVEQRLAAKLARGSSNSELIVALLDIDFFKRVNDGYGHLAGDNVLRGVGRMIRAAVRQGEYGGRYGGEEILLVLDDTDGCGVNRVLDLHHAVRGSPFGANDTTIRVTCSIGVAYASQGDDWESLIGRADKALYEAKSSGRDRVKESARGAQAARRVTDSRQRTAF